MPAEVGADHARVQCDDGQLRVPPVQLVGEEQVRQLGAAVDEERVVAARALQVVEVDGDRAASPQRRPVSFRVDVDHPAVAGLQQRQQRAGQRERRQLVDGEVQL
ncbi:hypothetical protein DY240_28030 [Jiangella rhizosphaerae]|uniref:Uncharacterized protein n=1 Tax=Jiangella rhizosphaerae TaxID=2293569 RepID=A0A418KHF0_9ACTN|nr:hypothetical protein DY240_28030 [Jiangella rhizosphaerae]